MDVKEWLWISVLLCTFGFFREMRPSEPFVMEFLSGEWRNITLEQVNREIYPIGTYCYLGLLVIVLLVTDMLRYKPVILLSSIAGIALWALLLWTSSYEGLLAAQFLYGVYMAAEVAYYTYIYAKVDREKYQIVTGHTRSAYLAGRFLGDTLGQILISSKLMNVRELNYISFGSQVTSLLFGLILPAAKTSLYFYTLPDAKKKAAPVTDMRVSKSLEGMKESNYNDESGPRFSTKDLKPNFSWTRAIRLLWRHFVEAYSNKTVVQWSLWWSLALAGYLQITAYVQILWKEIDPNNEHFYNGGVEAMLTLLSAGGAFAAGFLNSSKYQKWDLWILTVCSLIEGFLILTCAITYSIWLAYGVYILFGIVYNFMLTIASATVAKKLHEDSFALIFGINTIVAAIAQSLLTLIIVSDHGFALSPRRQFYSYAIYFVVLSVIYAIAGIVFLCRNSKAKEGT